MNRHEAELLAFFSGFLSEPRKELIEKVLLSRTRYVSVVLEDIYQPQNASAAVRTCDCFGVQDLHIIEKTVSIQGLYMGLPNGFPCIVMNVKIRRMNAFRD